jgi:hypothetical protein
VRVVLEDAALLAHVVLRPARDPRRVDHHHLTNIAQGWPKLRDLAQHFD